MSVCVEEHSSARYAVCTMHVSSRLRRSFHPVAGSNTNSKATTSCPSKGLFLKGLFYSKWDPIANRVAVVTCHPSRREFLGIISTQRKTRCCETTTIRVHHPHNMQDDVLGIFGLSEENHPFSLSRGQPIRNYPPVLQANQEPRSCQKAAVVQSASSHESPVRWNCWALIRDSGCTSSSKPALPRLIGKVCLGSCRPTSRSLAACAESTVCVCVCCA